MNKRFLSMLLIFCMLSMIPNVASAETVASRSQALDLTTDSVSYYKGTSKVSANPTNSNIIDTTEGWSWYIGKEEYRLHVCEGEYIEDFDIGGVLVLNGLILDETNSSIALSVPANTTILLKDDSSNSIINNTGSGHGLYSTGNITILGGGSLNSIGGNSTNSYGIGAKIIVIKSGSITAEGRDCSRVSGICRSYGTDGSIKMQGGSFTSIGGIANTGKNIYTDFAHSRGIVGSVEVTGGELTAIAKTVTGADGSSSFGIGNGGSITGGKVNAMGATAINKGSSLVIGSDTSPAKLENACTDIGELVESTGNVSFSIRANDTSKPVKIYFPVNAEIPVITNNLNTTKIEYAYGAEATPLSVTSTTTDGGTITYDWYSTEDIFIEATKLNVTTSTFTPSTTTPGTTYYYCVVTNTIDDNGDGGIKTKSIFSYKANIKVNEPIPYNISGTIKGIDTNEGIAATLKLKDSSGNYIGSPITANEDGTYTIPNVIYGTYSIEVSCEGYESNAITGVEVSNDDLEGKDLILIKTVVFVPVEDIIMTNATSVEVNTNLTLSAMIITENATNKNIVWSIDDANSTAATITGSAFRATTAGTAKVKATVINGLTESSDFFKIFDISIIDVPVISHNITATAIKGGTINPNGAITVNDKADQSFTITPDSNYSIADVKVDGISVGAVSNYIFTNVTEDHIISVYFSYNEESQTGRKTSYKKDEIIDVTVIPAAQGNLYGTTQGKIDLDGYLDKDNMSVTITDKIINAAIDKTTTAAKKNKDLEKGLTIVLNIKGGTKLSKSITVTLPKSVQEKIISNKIKNTILLSDKPAIKIEMNLDAITQINKQAMGDVSISAILRDKDTLEGNLKASVGEHAVYEIKASYGDGKQIINLESGSISVTIPYNHNINEMPGNLQAVYLDYNGDVKWLISSFYDITDNALHLKTDYLSVYGMDYRQNTLLFTDITSHWAKNDIEFAAGRNLFLGTGDSKFSPDISMSRGMFVTVLGRLAEADVSGYSNFSFSDIKADSYYKKYIEWAYENNIVKGVGNGKFAPDQPITREQMTMIMYNYAEKMDLALSKIHTKNDFDDSEKISSFSKDAVETMQMTGLLNGKDGNIFDPQGTATRAEVTSILSRFVRMVIKSDASGWIIDSGHWVYY